MTHINILSSKKSDFFHRAPTKMNFLDGVTFCKAKGLEIVTPNTEYENTQLFDYIKKKG